MFWVRVRVYLGNNVTLICKQRYKSKLYLKGDIAHPPPNQVEVSWWHGSSAQILLRQQNRVKHKYQSNNVSIWGIKTLKQSFTLIFWIFLKIMLRLKTSHYNVVTPTMLWKKCLQDVTIWKTLVFPLFSPKLILLTCVTLHILLFVDNVFLKHYCLCLQEFNVYPEQSIVV